MGESRRDPAGNAGGKKNNSSCPRLPAARGARKQQRYSDSRTADGMGGEQELRYLSPEYRQAPAAGRARLVGNALSRRGRGDPRSRGISDLSVSEGRSAQVPNVPD